MSKNLNLGIVPMTSTDSVEVNLDSILKSLEFFKNKNTHLVLFPENSLYFNFNKTLNKDHALKLSDPAWDSLKKKAQELNCYLHMGGVPLNEDGKVSNASVLLGPDGSCQVVYRKIHLFDVNVQGREVRESLSFEAGATPQIIDIGGWKIGMTICYDLRFSELFVEYHRQQADLIVVPSSFLVPTGRAHWRTLLKARAIETQAFVVAAAQVGTHKSQLDASLMQRQTWGESVAFEPWGECLGQTDNFDQFKALGAPLWLELDKSLIQKTREQIPLLSHRKLRF